jgi:hypothetical protein
MRERVRRARPRPVVCGVRGDLVLDSATSRNGAPAGGPSHRLGRVSRHREGKVAPRVDRRRDNGPTPALALPLTGEWTREFAQPYGRPAGTTQLGWPVRRESDSPGRTPRTLVRLRLGKLDHEPKEGQSLFRFRGVQNCGAARDPLLWRDLSSAGEVNSRRSPGRSKTAALRRSARPRTAWGGFAVTERAKSPRASITPAHNDPRRLSPPPAQNDLTHAGAERPTPGLTIPLTGAVGAGGTPARCIANQRRARARPAPPRRAARRRAMPASARSAAAGPRSSPRTPPPRRRRRR